MSNWNWKVVRQFLKQSFDLGLSRSSCLNYLHRLGFVLKRPKKRLLKAKDEERKAFVLQYSQIREEAKRVEPRSSSWMKPTFGPMPTCEANGYSRERQRWWTPPVPVGREGLLLLGSLSGDWGGGSHGNSWKQQCRDLHRLLQQLRANYPGPLVVIWDNGPAHRGAAIRSYLTTPDLHLRLVALPAYSQTSRPTKPSGTGPEKRSRPTNAWEQKQSPREDESILRRANSS